MELVVRFTLPGQAEQSVPLDQTPVMVGSLLSNQIVLPVPGVEPIHALLEKVSDGSWKISDLGSESGIRLNGKKIDVEAQVNNGDTLEFGTVSLILSGPAIPAVPDKKPGVKVPDIAKKAPPPKKAPPKAPVPAPGAAAARKSSQPPPAAASAQNRSGGIYVGSEQQKDDLLFSPKNAKPSGDVLEIVAYWGNTILEVEHFHPSMKEHNRVTIGDPTKAHFMAAGEESFSEHELATLQGDGYRLNLLPSMSARLRRGGSVERVEGGNHTLGCRDISHIKHGPVRYFFLFMRPPSLSLPKKKIDDPFFMGIMVFSLVFFLFFTGTLFTLEPEEKEDVHSDIWSIVHVPEKSRKIKKKEKEVKLVEIKKEPPPRKEPPKPEPKPVEPVKVKEAAKEPEKKPQKKEVANKMLDNLKKPKTGTPPPPPKGKDKVKPAGGSQAAGNKKPGGIRKGRSKTDIKGVAGVKNKKSSGVNLGKLGLGVGKIKSTKGPGAVYTKFRNSAGGAGGGSGSGKKTFGLGGVGSSVKTLGLAGSGNAMNQFGSSSKGFLGKGKGAGLGKAFGNKRGRAAVNVRPGDPLVSGGLTQQEILGVIRAELNQIRHCYEKLLQRSPNASGKIKVRFKVGTNGRVSSAKVVSSSIRDGSMKGCVVNVVRRWKFPPPRGGAAVDVNYPFSFNPI